MLERSSVEKQVDGSRVTVNGAIKVLLQAPRISGKNIIIYLAKKNIVTVYVLEINPHEY
jgi:hypothetical protein